MTHPEIAVMATEMGERRVSIVVLIGRLVDSSQDQARGSERGEGDAPRMRLPETRTPDNS